MPYRFILEHLAPSAPRIQPAEDSHMIYVGEKVVFFLKEGADPDQSGICIATKPEHHGSLLRQFPSLKQLNTEDPDITEWLLFPAAAADFETSVITACELVVEGDSRIGRATPPPKIIPKRRAKK